MKSVSKLVSMSSALIVSIGLVACVDSSSPPPGGSQASDIPIAVSTTTFDVEEGSVIQQLA
ncbi:MAG: hypothetical protein ACR2NT_03765 [Acidimicrobiia bacterium]